MPAGGFVGARGTDEDAFAAGDEALRVVGGSAADHADRERLGDVLGDREQLRHRLERLAEIILVQTGDDDALALIREHRGDGGQLGIEELPFVDADDFGIRLHFLEQLARAGDVFRLDLHGAVRGDVIDAVAVVDARLEDLDLALGDLRAAQPADQLLALAAEHAAGDHFDPAGAGPVSDLHQSFFWYSPSSVPTRIPSPTLTCAGTFTTRPVSSVAGFTCALAVARLMPGVVSTTLRSTVIGSSIPTGSSP